MSRMLQRNAVLVCALLGCAGSGQAPAGSVPEANARGRVIQLALGAYHTCALFEAGRVACWGDNQQGQLGTASTEASTRPLIVEDLDDVVEIASEVSTVCARRRNGDVLCWGANAYGQADPRSEPELSSSPRDRGGHCHVNEPPNYAPANVRHRPTPLSWLSKAVSVSVGHGFTCALHADGTASCWGDASIGQLGPGIPKSAFQKSTVGGLPPLVELESAGVYSCGRTHAGGVWCWGGYNDHAQLGTSEPGYGPRQVVGVSNAIQLAITESRACARVAGHAQVCWGGSGACGDTETKSAPTVVAELAHATDVVHANGGCFWCTLAEDHTLDCGPTPREPGWLTLQNVSAVSAGNDHACAILLDGGVQCWGSNVRGELGRHTDSDRDMMPRAVQW